MIKNLIIQGSGIISIELPRAHSKDSEIDKGVILCGEGELSMKQIKFLDEIHRLKPVRLRWLFDCISCYEILPKDNYKYNGTS